MKSDGAYWIDSRNRFNHSYTIKITDADYCKFLSRNSWYVVPLLHKIGNYANKDPNLDVMPLDVAGVVVNLSMAFTGSIVSQGADKLGRTLISANREFVDKLIYITGLIKNDEQEYINVVIDELAIIEMEEDGIGRVQRNNGSYGYSDKVVTGFNFSKEVIDSWKAAYQSLPEDERMQTSEDEYVEEKMTKTMEEYRNKVIEKIERVTEEVKSNSASTKNDKSSADNPRAAGTEGTNYPEP